MRASRWNLEDQVGGLVDHGTHRSRRRTGRLKRAVESVQRRQARGDQQPASSIRARRAA